MIQCPNCGEFQVREERYIPLPTGQSACLRRVGELWTTITMVIVVLGTLGIIGLMFWVGGKLPEEQREGCGAGCVIGTTATLLCLLPFALARGTSFLVSALTRFQKRQWGPAHVWPRRYWRACQSCGFEWMWKPGDPQKVRPRPRQQRPLPKQRRRQVQQAKGRAYQPFLDELLAHWNGTYAPEPGFSLDAPDAALAFFESYQRALGEEPMLQPGHRLAGFIRRHPPWREEILLFMRAYQRLRRGERAAAAQGFRALAAPPFQFADPWIWLSATVDDPMERIACLDKAIHLEPAHPLALDALDIAQGKVSPAASRREPESTVVVVRCSHCGGKLHYEPGDEAVRCRYCGREITLQKASLPGREAPSMTTLRLLRRYQGGPWDEVGRVLHCQTCGAALILSRSPSRIRHLAQECTYCGSTHVHVEDDPRRPEQPAGLLPFEIDEKEAAEAARTAGSSAGHPAAELESLRGLYAPFWMFDGAVEVRWLQTYQGQAPASEREEKIRYDDLLFPAVDVPPLSLLDEVPPFHLYKLVAYQAHFLADWPAQLPNLDVETAVEDAYDAMLALAHRRSGPAVRVRVSWDEQETAPSQTFRSFQVSDVTYQLVLAPLWVATLRSRKGRSLVLVNGQTGKVAAGLALPGDW